MDAEWITVGAGVGFPASLCVYLLVRMEKAINKLTEAVTVLTIKMKGGN